MRRLFIAILAGVLACSTITSAQQVKTFKQIPLSPTIPQGADSTVSVTASGHDTRFTIKQIGAAITPTVNVVNFGADPTGVADSSPACMAALGSLGLSVGGTIFFPPGQYYFAGPCNFPRFTSGTIAFQMAGATLRTDQAIRILNRAPADNTDANQIIAAKFTFRDGAITGTNTAGQVGIFLGASYGSEVIGTTFNNLDVGLYTAFALKTYVRNCFGFRNTTALVRFASGSGLWPGATVNNSQSNVSTIDSCRDFALAGQISSFEVLASDQIKIDQTVSEGNSPVNDIHFDTQGSTTVKSLLLRSVHSENAPTNAIVKLEGAGADVDIYNFIDQGGGSGYLAVDASTFSAGSISIESMPVVVPSPATPLFADGGGGQFWRFQDFGPGNSDPRNPAYWTGGAVPDALIGIGREPSGAGGQVFCKKCYLGSDTNVDTQAVGVFTEGNLFFVPDDTYAIGVTSNGPTNATGRPTQIAVGTGGIITEGDITPRTTGTVLVGNSTRAFAGVQLSPVGVADLPSCTGGISGQIRYVNNATSATFNDVAAAGGGNKMLVLCNGSDWTIH